MPEDKPIGQGTLTLKPGALWDKVVERTQSALQCGALQSIPTDYEFVEQDGIHFLVRILSNLAHKDAARQRQAQHPRTTGSAEFNPFLPYEEDLFVADLSETHLCLLNKFNVVDHHLLIITRAFEDQETLLTWRDFEALGACLAEIEGLAFYNAGKTAGASQRHKHLQLVPLPLVPEGPHLPIEAAIASAQLSDSFGTVPGLPYRHAITWLEPNWFTSPSAAAVLHERYIRLLDSIGLSGGSDNQPVGAYNLLATRKWMLIIPRSQESFASISVNSLGFAGSLFVRNAAQMKLLKDYGPMMILRQVAYPS